VNKALMFRADLAASSHAIRSRSSAALPAASDRRSAITALNAAIWRASSSADSGHPTAPGHERQILILDLAHNHGRIITI